MPKFFDLDGVERGLQWAVDKYKVQFLDAGNAPKFELKEVWETTGDASVNVTVLNANSGAQYKQPVAQSWPSLDKPWDGLPLVPKDASKSLWSSRCMWIYTDTKGHAGFGFGGDAVMHEDGGPLSFWVLSPSTKSDGLAKIGWDGATDHTVLGHLVFQLVTAKPSWRCRLARWLCPEGMS